MGKLTLVKGGSPEYIKYVMDSCPMAEKRATVAIRITIDVKKRLDRQKIHKRETYNDVLERILDLAETRK